MRNQHHNRQWLTRPRASHLFTGLIVAISAALVAFEWTSYSKKVLVETGGFHLRERIEVETLPVSFPKKPKPADTRVITGAFTLEKDFFDQ